MACLDDLLQVQLEDLERAIGCEHRREGLGELRLELLVRVWWLDVREPRFDAGIVGLPANLAGHQAEDFTGMESGRSIGPLTALKGTIHGNPIGKHTRRRKTLQDGSLPRSSISFE